MIGQEEWVVDKPMSPAEIRDAVYAKVQCHEIVQAVLQQETALYCGKLIVTNPELFEGILKIRMGYIETNYLLLLHKKCPYRNHF